MLADGGCMRIAVMRYLLWFANDLRLDDNPALLACQGGHCLLPLYVLDTRQFEPGPPDRPRIGVHRARFLLESLAALDGALRQRGSQLLVLCGDPLELIPRLVEHFDLQQVVTQAADSAARQQQIEQLRQRLGGCTLRQTPGNLLLAAEQRPWPEQEAPRRFSAFREALAGRVSLFQPHPAPAHLPPLPDHSATLQAPLPGLSQLGLGEPYGCAGSAFPFAGGEAAAQARLRDFLWEGLGIRDYLDNRDRLLSAEASSRLSPWLANGCLSVRRVAAELRRHEAQHGRSEATQAFWEALLRREFFLCQPLTDISLPGTATDPRLTLWCVGRSGMPLVDASMRELAATGFIAHRCRQLVAAYLIVSLEQDWRHGAAWFEEHLLDHLPASNWASWRGIAELCRDPQRAETFNPLRMARELDPQAEYVSFWLPELRALPPHLRHTPFLQQQASQGYPLVGEVHPSWLPYLPAA